MFIISDYQRTLCPDGKIACHPVLVLTVNVVFPMKLKTPTAKLGNVWPTGVGADQLPVFNCFGRSGYVWWL